jgi:hypothetical protein
MRHAALLLTLAATGPVPLGAQIRASERGQVRQVVDGTTITIDYARPRVRGRARIFGGAVRWGEVWTPGANMATTLETDHDILVDGHAVPKGKYSVWFVTDSAARWTIVLDTMWRQYHEDHPPARPGQIRWPVGAASGPATEVLTWTFPALTATGGVMQMAWADRVVLLPFTVPPSHPVSTDRAEALPLTGRYHIVWLTKEGKPDPANPAQTIVVTYEKGALLARWEPPLWGPDPQTYLIRIARNWFSPGFRDRQGAVTDVFTEWVLEFDVASGRAGSFEVRGEDDTLWGRGERLADGPASPSSSSPTRP